MMDATKLEQTAVNDSGTNPSADARLTREDSRPVLYEVVSCMGIKSPMKFDSIQKAAEFAKYAFPDQEQDPDRTGAGWDIQIVSQEA